MNNNESKSKIGLIVLAAGSSSRLGMPKQFVAFHGKTLLQKIVEEALASVCSPVVVVTGKDAGSFAKHLENYDVEITENDNWERGMGISISCGIKKITEVDKNLGGIVLCVCDQPFVSAKTINNLADIFLDSKYRVIASAYGESLGVPALFDKTLFAELAGLKGKNGAKKIIERFSGETFSVAFPEGAIDVDTREDVENLQKF